MKTAKRDLRVKWILENVKEIKEARLAYDCPENCRAKCNNGATCRISSDGGWGYWAQAFKIARVYCEKRNYWSGTGPTPSTAISKGIAKYILEHAPAELM